MLAAFAGSVAIVDGDRTRRELLGRGRCVFEGAQGVLLDEWFGWHPHTTWSTTTFANAAELLGGRDAVRLGVVRTYTTRHGAGPHPTEDAALAADLPEPHNGADGLQGTFRRGHFDAVAHRYAVAVAGGVDALALTHLDAPGRAPELGICTAYRLPDGGSLTRIPVGTRGDLAGQERLTALLRDARPAQLRRPRTANGWTEEISGLLEAPVVLTSDGPRTSDARLMRQGGPCFEVASARG
jgi:adenylosuccinate synthase